MSIIGLFKHNMKTNKQNKTDKTNKVLKLKSYIKKKTLILKKNSSFVVGSKTMTMCL